MRVDKIQRLKNNKYKITIDGESIVTYDGVILENNLLYKKQIDSDLYNIILNRTRHYEVYNKVMNYSLKKKRSETEVKNYLIKYDIEEEKKQEIIGKLKRNKIINDIDYCKSYINDSIYLGKKGINKIKLDLLNQNIPNSIIDDALDSIDIELVNKNLEKQIIKKIKMNKKYSNNYIKQKILNEMILLGYDKQKILNILEDNLINDSSIIQKTFEKYHEKLSKKYSGVELEYQIKNKLLSKGFNSSDINNLLQEKTEK